MSYTPGPLPPYLYGKECAENERVWTKQSVKDYTAAEVARAVAAERERCAKVCEGMHPEDRPGDYAWAIRTEWADDADPQRLQGKGE